MKTRYFFLPVICIASLICSSCQKELTDDSKATGTLKDASGNCMPAIISGIFYNGIPLSGNTTYVTLKVNVTQKGAYSIYTNRQNGFQFADSGFFNTTGVIIIKLKPIGIPLLPSPTSFNVIFDTSICAFTVDVKDSSMQQTVDTSQTPLNSWKFMNTTDSLYFKGPAVATFNNDSGLPVFVLNGTTASGDTVLLVTLTLPSPVIQYNTGTYITNKTNSFYFSTTNGSLVKNIYSADADTAQKMNIWLIDYTPDIMTGLFFGSARDADGNTINISNGSFMVQVK